MPYRTAGSVIDGVVLTFVGINRLKQAEGQAADVGQCFAEIVRVAREPLILLDEQLRVLAANEPFCRIFHVTMAEAAGNPIYALDERTWDSPPLRARLREVAQGQGEVSDFPLAHEFPGGRRMQFLLNARALNRLPADAAGTIILALTEVAGEKKS
jgi:PAS domain-containing protein